MRLRIGMSCRKAPFPVAVHTISEIFALRAGSKNLPQVLQTIADKRLIAKVGQ
jgi:hypothetical protein